MKVLIATAKHPTDVQGFEIICNSIRELAEEQSCKIVGGIIWTAGFGCSNVAMEVQGENAETFANYLTMGLQPARWAETFDIIPETDTWENQE